MLSDEKLNSFNFGFDDGRIFGNTLTTYIEDECYHSTIILLSLLDEDLKEELSGFFEIPEYYFRDVEMINYLEFRIIDEFNDSDLSIKSFMEYWKSITVQILISYFKYVGFIEFVPILHNISLTQYDT